MIDFIKMHGLGNDFVIIDGREKDYNIDVKKIAHRKFGVGCDQVIIIKKSEYADCFMQIYNADGSESGACGNATRCVAKIIMQNNKLQEVDIAVKNKLLHCTKVDGNNIKVNMGLPSLDWEEIPLSFACNPVNLPISYSNLSLPIAVNMGNPHVVFFVDDINAVNLCELGPQIANDPIFLEKANVNIAQIDGEKIVLKVWERGVGETLACGSGACATLVAAVLKSKIKDKRCLVQLPGGQLFIEWDGAVFMTGSVSKVFEGTTKE